MKVKSRRIKLKIVQIKAVRFIIAVLTGIAFLMGMNLEVAQAADNLGELMEKAKKIESSEKGMDQLISLDLRGLDVTDALKYLSVRGGMNIMVSRKVSGRVTFLLKDVPIKDVFDVILRSNDLAYEKRGDIYTVMSGGEYQKLYGERFSDVREVKLFRLKYAIPGNAFTLIDAMKSDIGRLVVDQDSGTILIMDTPEKVKEIMQAISVLEEKNVTKIFELKYAKAKDVEEQLRGRLDAKSAGTIKADERSNQIIVQTFPERMKEIEQLIESLDGKTLEVLIDTKIIKITLSDDSDVGIEWEGLFNSFSARGDFDFIGSHPISPLDRLGKSFVDDFATRVASTTDLGSTSRVFTSTSIPIEGGKMPLTEKIYFGKTNEWESVISFLKTIGKTKILSNPKLAVINGREAKIHVGKREAYVTTTTTTGQTTTTISEDVTFIDVGIQLSVTPIINADGFVTMKIKPEISSVVSTLKTPSNNLIPIVDTSLAETTVMVKDGTTIIVGGLRKTERVYQSKEVPFFSKLPLIGNLLKSQTHDNEHTELLILITPHVVRGDMLVTGSFKEIGERGIRPYRDYNLIAETKTEKIIDEPEKIEKGGIKPYRGYAPMKRRLNEE